jgi:large subunit ribosomal protein L7/L12
MSIKSVEILENLKKLSLTEAQHLVSIMKEFFEFKSIQETEQKIIKNIKIEEVSEKVEFTLILEEVPAEKKIAILKVIRTLTNLGLKEVKELVESAPKIVKENLTKEAAENAKNLIEVAGGKATYK